MESYLNNNEARCYTRDMNKSLCNNRGEAPGFNGFEKVATEQNENTLMAPVHGMVIQPEKSRFVRG